MLSTSIPTVVFGGLLVGFPTLAASGDLAPGWLQLGLGGAAMFLVYVVLKPLVKSQIDSNKKTSERMDEIAKTQAASVEIQRQLLQHAESSSQADAVLAQAVGDLRAQVATLPR